MNVAPNLRGPGVPETPSPAFAVALFGRVPREDLAHFSSSALVILAEYAWRHLRADRAPGRPALRIFDPEGADPAFAEISVIEIVNDDMPFLLDSTLAELAAQGIETRLVAHPVFAVGRDEEGRATSVSHHLAGARTPHESLIHIQVARLDEDIRARLIEALEKVYADVRAAVADWAAMRARLEACVADWRAAPPALPANEVAEAIQFLEWLLADNFTFLGMREYRLDGIGDAIDFSAVGESGLGILRDPDLKVLRRGRELVTVTPEVLEFLRQPQALIITKANAQSRVHRRTHLDYVGVKQFSPGGKLIGELRVVGLFTATAYTRPAARIPYLRHKIARVIEDSDLDPDGHSGRALTNILETFPRDELFQIEIPTLARFAEDLIALYERPRIRVLARLDKFDRFVSLLVYIPRDRYDTRARVRVGEYLARTYDGRVAASNPYYPEGPLVRTHYIIGRYEGVTPLVRREELEAGVAAIVRTWDDRLRDALGAASPDARRYAAAFSAGYMEAFGAATACEDIALMNRLGAARAHALHFYLSDSDAGARLHLKVFLLGRPMPLSERVPMLEHMGFRVVSERTFDIAPAYTEARIWLHDMMIETADGAAIDLAARRDRLEETLMAVLLGEAESDGYNALSLANGASWRDITLLRALSRYLRQAGVVFNQTYMWQTLVRNAGVAGKLVELFYARFDPAKTPDARAGEQADIRAAIEAMLADVASLDEDRILRRFANLIEAAVRTNFFQQDGEAGPRPALAIKFESRRIDELPAPRPLYEISVYAPRVEGVHLRFGKVARGGLRWSDRPQDFRTEVLGLVKAQQVKNAVIVPVGAKGGFVAKQLPPPADREAWMAEGVAAYSAFVGALLDVTDTIEADRVRRPRDVIRHDGDDPYLVVAADKGTATFSDIANGIAVERGFWLGDAFASGGSAGYDHKKMGITARGAWEAVKRHFREMDIDIQTTPFTVAGVGDMSGDVFGNAMLLSPHIRLVAAFDHRDIFIDPDPDTAEALAERARLFALPRSSWRDYEASIISAGGGVYSRAAKEIQLSPQARVALGVDRERATPQEVIRAILGVPVDLLWFGGIGAYVRASEESDDTVGDRANDALRISAGDLRCKVIGEGANLAVTQRGRIEAALRGVRLNTDAIDNSAGVNTSDIEVNLKIALAERVRSGALDLAGRNELLAHMTNDVAALVLANNYQQTLAISVAARRGVEDVPHAIALMQSLERRGKLDRGVEFLPSDAMLETRARTGRGLTRPELSVLLAYAKLALHEDLLASDVPDDPWLSRELVRYFPRPVVERFPEAIARHPLRREIVTTGLVNAIVDHGGPTVLARIEAETRAGAPALARAFAVAREVFGLIEISREIDAYDNRMPTALQLELHARVQELLLSRLVWFIRNVDFSAGLEAVGARFRSGVEALTAQLGVLAPAGGRADCEARAADLIARGAPEPLARRIASLPPLAQATEIALVAERAGRAFEDVAATFFAVEETLGLGALIERGHAIAAADVYDAMARDRSILAIEDARRAIVANVAAAGGKAGEDALNAWTEQGGDKTARLIRLAIDAGAAPLTLSKLSVAADLIADLSRA